MDPLRLYLTTPLAKCLVNFEHSIKIYQVGLVVNKKALVRLGRVRREPLLQPLIISSIRKTFISLFNTSKFM
jgi:hypothetical protein